MNFNQLRYFVSVIQCQSFTKAASRHYISQTAITQQIHALETSLDVMLIDRKTRPISPTAAGRVFYREALSLLSRIDSALEKTKNASDGLIGTLRIGYTKGYERSSLSEKLRQFHLEYPNILITCHRHDTDKLAAGLLNHDYDIIFTWDSTHICQEDGIRFQLIERAPLVVAVYNSHPFARLKSLRREDLKDETILYMSPSATGESFGDSYFLELYHKAGYHPNILIRSNDTESILMMVAAEEGISILPAYTTDKLVDAKNLTFLPLIGEYETEDILAVWKDDAANLTLSHFIEAIK
jgi:LysR family transcriptional activator of glutamate synthase operon